MESNELRLRKDELSVYALRERDRRYGYAYYRAGRLEEYELYARHKSFLQSDRILTFTDTDGRLMAMKPDVTLSIVKSYAGEHLQKLCYYESVYRPDEGGFRQIQQTGLECIGAVDGYLQCEVLALACRSLESISEDYLLDLSHLGFVTALAEEAVGEELRRQLLESVGQKNTSAIRALCRRAGTPEALCDDLLWAATSYGPPEEMLGRMRAMVRGERMQEAWEELRQTTEDTLRLLPGAKLRVDLSMLDDLHYYNGLIFRGMIRGIPAPVLSGGRYDNLLERMGKQGRAIGFAIYLNLLERFGRETESYDADVLLLYGPETSPAEVIAAAEALRSEGLSVRAQTEAGGVRARRTARLVKGECVWDE